MRRLLFCILGALIFVGLLAIPVAADTVNVYTVGSSPPGNALDPGGNNIGGIPVITWQNFYDGNPGDSAVLSILAEGVDGGPNAPGGGEFDEVFVNGNFVGDLTQQDFYSPAFNLQPGPGALPGITAETWSFFDVAPFVNHGLNTITVVVDPGNWVNEIEVADLSVPEPGSFLLFGTGLAGLAAMIRRMRK